MEVRQSKLKGAGLGLFSTKRYKAGTLIGVYCGTFLNEKEFLKTKDTSYTWEIGKGSYVDGKPIVLNNPLRYVNGAKTKAQKFLVNVIAYTKQGQIVYKTIKPIDCGEEFIVDYGREYWN